MYSYFVLALVVALSPWSRILFSQNTLLSFVLMMLLGGALLFFERSKKKKILFIAIAINIILLVLTLPGNFDSKLSSVSRVEQDLLVKRFDYYGKDLEVVYTNRFGIFYHYKIEPVTHKYEANLFEYMDINNYFFASHPRELGFSSEFKKFPVILLPLLVIGFFASFISFGKVTLLFSFNLIASAFYSLNSPSGPILLYPYLVFFITFGFCLSLEKCLAIIKKTR